MRYMIVFMCLCLSVVAQAAPLYEEQVRISVMDEEKLQEAVEQIEEHTEVALKENLFVSPFHKRSENRSTDKKPFCNTCHLQSPHSENERKRSFLNMHTRYISCESCHFRPEDIRLEYRWLDFNEEIDEESAKRITPFYDDEAVLVFSEHELGKLAKETWEDKSSANASLEKAKLKLRLHAPLKEEGPGCLDCHDRKDQLLDLESLGYSKKDIVKLQQHAIPRFFNRFSKEDQRLRMSDLLQ